MRFELKIGLVAPTTVMVSVMLASSSVNVRSCTTPSPKLRLFCAGDRNPVSAAVTVYGPPTRMPGIRSLHHACVTASYVVPDGWCTAVTFAPGTTAPCASVPAPVDAARRNALRVDCARGDSSDKSQ